MDTFLTRAFSTVKRILLKVNYYDKLFDLLSAHTKEVRCS